MLIWVLSLEMLQIIHYLGSDWIALAKKCINELLTLKNAFYSKFVIIIIIIHLFIKQFEIVKVRL